MKLPLNWPLFLLTAASYIFYPAWNLPLHPAAQWGLLNIFVLISAAVLYSPLGEVSQDLSLPELKKFWPALLAAAAVCLPFWLTPLPTGSDDQSHAGPAAWLLGRAATASGLDIRLLPLIFIPLAALAGWIAYKIYKKGWRLPGRGAAVLALAAAANLWFLADLRYGAADALGRFETVLRYPPLSKFLYLGAYLLLGVNEAAPRAVQFLFIALSALYLLRLLKLFRAEPPTLAFLLFALFPTFFNLAISAELEAGTVFFFTAAIYHFIKASEDGDRGQFLKCAFWAAVGFFYKQLTLGLLISFVPAIAALLLLRPALRPAWLYGLKALLIPAAAGLPFIILSAALGIRDTALQLANLLDPRLLTLDLVNIYQTSGAVITFLLAAATAWALLRRRSQALWLLLYFAASYYIMISASAAVGFIRHAQPFYIAPVFLLVLWACEARKSFPLGSGVLWAVLLYFFASQSILAHDPYQRKTAYNFRANVFPYDEAAQYLKGLNLSGLRIYAPMEVEPSHFYLAKHGLAGKIIWDRGLPQEFSAGTAAKTFKAGGYDFLLLPYSPFPGLSADFTGITDALRNSGEFNEEKLFDYGGNKLLLLSAAGRPG
jgi:hypothetical protein